MYYSQRHDATKWTEILPVYTKIFAFLVLETPRHNSIPPPCIVHPETWYQTPGFTSRIAHSLEKYTFRDSFTAKLKWVTCRKSVIKNANFEISLLKVTRQESNNSNLRTPTFFFKSAKYCFANHVFDYPQFEVLNAAMLIFLKDWRSGVPHDRVRRSSSKIFY